MKLINPSELESKLRTYEGQSIYMHVETVPGSFVRNVRAQVVQTYVAGSDGGFRVALRLAENGWIRAEGLTHWILDEENRLLLASHDDKGRLTTALELSQQPFPA